MSYAWPPVMSILLFMSLVFARGGLEDSVSSGAPGSGWVVVLQAAAGLMHRQDEIDDTARASGDKPSHAREGRMPRRADGLNVGIASGVRGGLYTAS
jgi:hypothetical protein